ncbi:MAG: spermidine acetyltransferase, partial [Clostridia bacterium]
MLSLQRVTDANVTEVLHLHTKPEQAGFIESMEQCMCDAGKYDGWRPTAIYDDETIVGFAMYGYCESENHVWLDRF